MTSLQKRLSLVVGFVVLVTVTVGGARLLRANPRPTPVPAQAPAPLPNSVPVTVVNTPLPVHSATHLGVPANKLITLYCNASHQFSSLNQCSSFTQVNADGTFAPTSYTIPPGETLVVLDIDWEAIAGTPSTYVFLDLNGVSTYSPTILADANGIAAGADHLSAGLPFTVLPTVIVSLGTSLSGLHLHGYLTP